MLQRRHYRKISESAEATRRTLEHIHTGPEHTCYYDVLDWFTSALRLMTAEQRLQLLQQYRQQLDIFDISFKDLDL